jgi:hypothetical protein
LSPTEIARQRLANQGLVRPTQEKPEGVVRRLGAVQSQDYGAAKWAVAQRMPAASDEMVERAFADGSIVRTHLLRPTWHFVTRDDIRWMLALSAPRVLAVCAYPFRQLELDAGIFRRSNAALTRALQGGKQLTRAEIAQVFRRARVDTTGPLRLGYLMMRAELDGVVCSGPRRGKQFTYALLDERVPAAKPVERDDALSRLTMTYFTTRGPATVHDMAVWSGLTIADVRRGIAIAGGGLRHETVDGRPYWMAAAQPPAAPPTGVAHLLPNYDEFFIGFKDRSAFRDVTRSPDAKPPSAALMGHIVTIDGAIVGGWKRTLRKGSVSVELNPIVSLSTADRRSIADAAEKFGAFLGLEVELTTV